ncbi:MAG: hypothetical protein KJ984_02815 [Nanoarchaeota archaeon]|nr:hypothetical protein [Nanoarchaeota archaeon]
MKTVYVALDKEEDHDQLINYLHNCQDIKMEVFQWFDYQYFSSYVCQLMNATAQVTGEKPTISPDLLIFDPDIYVERTEFNKRKKIPGFKTFEAETGKFERNPLTQAKDIIEQKNQAGIYMVEGFISFHVPTIVLYREQTKPVYHHFQGSLDFCGIEKPYFLKNLVTVIEKSLK